MQDALAPVKAVKGNTLPVFRGLDYTGKTIGDWKILGPMTCERVPNSRNYKTKWLCQCVCGSAPHWVIKENLTRGLSRGCYQCYGTRNSGNSNPNWKGHGDISGEVFNKVRSGARERGIDLAVTAADLHYLWQSQGPQCALTGLTLVMGETASLDRINSNDSYRIGNIQWVHKTVNIMKNDFPEETFIEMCRLVARHRNPQENPHAR